MTPTFVELKRQSQGNLTTFLQTETKLAATFCDLFQRTENPEHRARLMGDMQKIVNVLRHFQERIEDRSIRADILKKADGLSEFLVRHSE